MRRRHAAMFGLAVIGHVQNKGVGSALMKAMIDDADRWTTFTTAYSLKLSNVGVVSCFCRVQVISQS
jgi:GNAT superfamily N-acetyltransferase